MKHIKTAVWIIILSVLYATGILRLFNISAELMFCFAGVYALLNKNFKETTIVALVCAALMSGLGGRGFVFSMLACVYCAFVFFAYKPKRYVGIKSILLSFVAGLLFEGCFYLFLCFDDMTPAQAMLQIIIPSAVYTAIIYAILYNLVKKSYQKKERYIF